MEIEYIGEQSWWGHLGHLSVVVAFVTAIFGVIASYLRVNSGDLDGKWKQTARILYTIHSAAVFSIFITLLSMLIAHRFEYQYVWQHTKRDMNMNYVLAALWEGQEGSTLLWLTWHAILGFFVLRKGGEWEGPVLGVVSLVQVFLSMMLLGFYFGDTHIGSSPFTLIRLREENIGLPWTQLPDYLTRIPMLMDGQGLNPLLQNYWMTIHPPTLFCGFALVTFPFAYAIAGLWTGKLYTWQKPALTWAFVGVAVLGTGILMGGAWAYESLNFGGFWAWDPVENASLVPWLVLVGAAHVMLIHKIKGRSLFTTFLLTISAFLLIVYSTFLTKSGILAKTSVHAFTEDGLNQELVLFMGFFLWLSICFLTRSFKVSMVYTACASVSLFLFIEGSHAIAMLLLLVSSAVILIYGYRKGFPREEKEEELWSREFWMFIGSLVLVVSSVQIIFWTSTPVFNKFLQIDFIHQFCEWLYAATGKEWAQKLMEANVAPDRDVIHFYNKWQAAFAILVAFLMGQTQFLKYRNSKFSDVQREIMWPSVIAVVITALFGFFVYFGPGFRMLPEKKQAMFVILIFLIYAATFSVAANTKYWLKILKGRISKAGASIAHIGFALLLLGAVISTSKKETISVNTSGIDISDLDPEGKGNEENIYMRRGDTLPMGEYMVSYSNRYNEIRNGTRHVFFTIDFFERDNMTAGEKAFTLEPFIQVTERQNASEPDTRHYLHKDIYSFVMYVPMDKLKDDATVPGPDEFDTPKNNTIAPGDTVFADNAICVLDSIRELEYTPGVDSIGGIVIPDTNLIMVGAYFKLIDRNLNTRTIRPVFYFNRLTGQVGNTEVVDEISGTKLVFWKIRADINKIDVYSSIQLSKMPDFIVLQAYVFPAINVLWLGCLIMIFGTAIAIRERVRRNKKEEGPEAVPQEGIEKAEETSQTPSPDEKA